MITLRQADISDLSSIQELNDEVFVDNRKYDADLDLNWAQGSEGHKYFSQLLQNPEALCLIAEDDGKKIGYIAGSPKVFSYRMSKYAELENMGVTPEYRSQGVGSMLIDKFFEWAKKKGLDKVYLSAYSANTGALAFYKKKGLVEIDVSLEKEL